MNNDPIIAKFKDCVMNMIVLFIISIPIYAVLIIILYIFDKNDQKYIGYMVPIMCIHLGWLVGSIMTYFNVKSHAYQLSSFESSSFESSSLESSSINNVIRPFCLMNNANICVRCHKQRPINFTLNDMICDASN